MKRLRAVLHAITLLLVVTSLLACSSSDDQPEQEPEAGMDDAGINGDGDAAGDAAETADAATDEPLVPTVTDPPDVGFAQIPVSQFVDLESYGYHEREYLFEGEATAYEVEGELTTDGKWTLREAGTAPYKTRMYVRIPDDPADFNGTVVVEWLNVSGGADGDPGYMYNHQMAHREGWVWVAVSAQIVGIEGGGPLALLGGGDTTEEQVFGQPLKVWDPERYESLTHPGDDYSFDIFSQATRVVLNQANVDVLEGLEPERLIAYGESQSAGRMTSYVNGVHPLTQLFDGYFIHSRAVAGSAFTTDGSDIISSFIGGRSPQYIRDDLDVPVFQFQTETDVHGMLGFVAARQPNTDMLVTWEVAGTSHADKYLVDLGGDIAASVGLTCENANDGPQQFVIKAALLALDRWIADGTFPPTGELLELDESNNPVPDEYGNTRGGVRSPDVDVPIAVLSTDAAPTAEGSGIGPLASFCGIFGSTTPFTSETLHELYATHEEYVSMVEESANAAVEQGFLLEPEAKAMIEEAEAAPVPE